MASSRGAVLLLTGILLTWGGARAKKNKCPLKLDQVKVQPNFDIERFLGRWNEIVWVAPSFYAEDQSTDFYHVYDRETNGNIVGYASGRDVLSAQCFGYRFHLRETKTPGLLVMLTPGERSTLYYVLYTDYISKAVVYGCYDYDDNASICYNGRAWLLSRDTRLHRVRVKNVFKRWSKMCLDIDTLLKYTAHTGNGCPLPVD